MNTWQCFGNGKDRDSLTIDH